jgi:acetyltransferase-like isoleucine patch superfamily enzyme
MNSWKFPTIEHNKPTKWNWTVSHPEGFTMGEHTDIGAYTYIQAGAGVTIEDNVQIGSHCSIHSISSIDNKIGPVRICKDAKIGMHSAIMPGVTVGEGATVGAFSFVNKSIPAHELWYGVPASFRQKLTESN